jgi:hypothetical protein
MSLFKIYFRSVLEINKEKKATQTVFATLIEQKQY